MALVSRQLAVVVNAAASSFLLCFGYAVCLLCFFPLLSTVFLPLQWLRRGVVDASGASGGGEKEDGPWYTKDAALVLFSVFSSSSSCILLCFVHSPPSLSLSDFLSFPCSPLFLCSRFPFFFFFSFSLWFPLSSLFFFCPCSSSSPCSVFFSCFYRSEREPCAGNGQLVLCM